MSDIKLIQSGFRLLTPQVAFLVKSQNLLNDIKSQNIPSFLLFGNVYSHYRPRLRGLVSKAVLSNHIKQDGGDEQTDDDVEFNSHTHHGTKQEGH